MNEIVRQTEARAIAKAIELDGKALCQEAGVDAVRLIKALYNMSVSDIGKVIKWDDTGKVRVTPSDELEASDLFAIKKVKMDDEGRINGIDFYERQPAIDKLLKILGYDKPDANVNVNISIEDKLREMTMKVLSPETIDVECAEKS